MPDLSDKDKRRYQEIEDELATLDAASDRAATLRLERSELDAMIFDDCSQNLPVRQYDNRCLWCGTNHALGECQWVRKQIEESRRQG